MKKVTKIIVLLIVVLTGLLPVSAQSQGKAGKVKITNLQMIPVGDDIEISFTAGVNRNAVKSDYELIVTPSLVNGNNQVKFPAFIVQGRRARIAQQRSEMVSGETDEIYNNKTIIRSGESVKYKTRVAYGEWMEGSTLVLDGFSRGCCSEEELPEMLALRNIEVYPQYVESVPVRGRTTGDRLAETLPFIAHNNDYQKFLYNPDNYINTLVNDNTVNGFGNSGNNSNLTVYFHQGRHNIDMVYRDNRYSLERLISAIRELESSTDSHVTKVIIAGFASPEGTAEINTRLGQARADITRSYLIENSLIRAEQIDIYNGKVNWIGLRNLVARSDMAYRDRILNIIDNVPEWDSGRKVGRHGELMRLGGGEPYRYMLRNFFPELRNATYIKVYYENK